MSHLLRYFSIRGGETAKVMLFFVLMLIISLYYTLSSTLGDSLFIAKVGEERLNDLLPWYYVAVGVGTIVTTYLVDYLLEHSRKLVLFIALEVVFAISIVLFRWGLDLFDSEGTYFALMVWLEICALITIALFFSYIGDYFTSREARRLYGFINGGYPVGNVIMGFGVEPMLNFVSAEDLLILCSILLIATAAIPLLINKKATTVINREEMNEVSGGAPLKKVFTHPFIILIFIMITADLFYFVLTDFELKLIAAKELTAVELAAFFGMLYGVIGAIQLFIQFGLVSLLLKKIGIINSLMINAIFSIAAILAFIAHPTLAFIAGANIIRYTFSETVDIPARELLFFPLVGRLRERAQTFANGILAPLAQGLGGLFLLLLLPLLPDNIYIAYVAVGFALLWLISMVALVPKYQKTLEDSLENWDANPESMEILFESDNGRTQLAKLLDDRQRHSEIRALLDFIPPENLNSYLESFYRILDLQESRELRVKVLQLLGENHEHLSKLDLDRVRPLLHEDDPKIVIAATEALCRILQERAFEEVGPLMYSNTPQVRITATALLGNYGGLDAAVHVYSRIKEELEGSSEERIEAVRTIALMNRNGSASILRPLLAESNSDIQQEVLNALSQMHDPELVPDILQLIDLPGLEDKVVAALESMPESAAPHLIDFLEQQQTLLDPLTSSRLLRSLGQLPHPDSLNYLTVRYDNTSDSLIRIACLTSMQKLSNEHELNPGFDWLRLKLEELTGDLQETQKWIQHCSREQALGLQLLTDHYHCLIELLFTLLNLYYRNSSLQKATFQYFSDDPVQHANALELFELHLEREHKRHILPLVVFHSEAQSRPETDAEPPWVQFEANTPWLNTLAIFLTHRITNDGEAAVEDEHKNIVRLLSTVSFLKKVKLFSEIPANYLIPIAEMVHHCDFYAGEVLFEEGDSGDSLYLIQKGCIEILISGTPIPLSAGEAIGEMALIDGEPRSATARVCEDSKLLQLRSYDFNRLLNSYPVIAKALLRILSQRLRNANSGTNGNSSQSASAS